MTFDDVTPSGAPRTRKHNKTRSREDFIQGLMRAVDFLEPGENLNRRSLKRIAREHPEADGPSSSPVERNAAKYGQTFTQWCDEALARRRADSGPAKRRK